MTKGGAYMVSEGEQIDFFNTIFGPLRQKVSAADVKLAGDTAKEFVEGVWPVNSSPEFQDWNTKSLDETETESWKWLIGIRKAYPLLISNGIEVHKFVWHKKPNEAGWGPKVVIKVDEGKTREFQYITKPLEEKRRTEIQQVGTMFNLFQPNQQEIDHDVWSHEIPGTTTFKVIAEKGDTIDKEFDDCIKDENFLELENLFNKIIKLYLQKRIGKNPSIGFVEAQKPSWKKKKTRTNTWQKELENLEKETPFLIPLRWVGTENRDCISLLHGDEWGGNFIGPVNPDAGSVRPIDFEDAHIQGVEVSLNQDNNIDSYIKPLKNTHKTAGGDLAYRFSDSWKYGDPPPLHAYSCMAALGRLLTALIQKRCLTSSLSDDENWIEPVTASFFYCLRSEISKFISSNGGKNLIQELELNPKYTQHGLMARAVLASYQWSEYWKYKDRETDEDAEHYRGKWKKSSLEEFQFQLRVQAEWEMTVLDSKGRVSTYATDYVTTLQHEYDSGDWNEREMNDLKLCMEYIETCYSHGPDQGVPSYQELSFLRKLKWMEINPSELVYINANSKYDRLANKICIICSHLEAHQLDYSHEKFTEDHRKFLKDCRKGPEIHDFPEDTRNDITHLANGHGVTLSIAQHQFNFNRRGELLTMELANEIVEPINKAIIALKKHPIPRQMGSDFLKSFRHHVRLLNGFRSRWKYSSKSPQEIIDTTILSKTKKLSEWLLLYYQFPQRKPSEIRLLTELLRTMDHNDRTYKDLVLSIDITRNTLVCLRNIDGISPHEDLGEFTKYLETGIKRTITWIPRFPRNESYKHDAMKMNVELFEQISALRDWAIDFRNQLNPSTLNPHKEQEWYLKWMEMT